MARLTDEQRSEIRELHATGDWSQTALMKRFGVSRGAVQHTLDPEKRRADARVRVRKHWANATEEQREAAREYARKYWASMTEEQRGRQLEATRKRRANMTEEQREARREYDREWKASHRRAYDRANPGKHFKEGGLSVKDVKLTVRERSSGFRQAVLARWGLECYGCGVANVPWLHAHHLEQLAEGERVSTAEDGRPLCPTCHAAVHYFAKPPAKMLSMDDLRHLLQWLRDGGHLTTETQQ